MTLIEMIAAVAVLSQYIKEALFQGKVKKRWAVLLTLISSAAVVAFNYLNMHIPFNAADFILNLVKVFVGANGGYKLLKVVRPK